MAGNKLNFPRTPGSGQERANLNEYRFTDPIGNVLWVDSVTGTDAAGYGRSPASPVASIAYALANLVTADNNDVVLVAPKHVETITAAAGVAMNVAGVTVRGLGRGRQRPTINYTTAVGASWDVTAARCSIQNLTFTPIGVDAVTAAVNVQAADCTIEDCEFELANATNQAVLGVLTNASADRFRFERNHVHGTSDAGTAAAIRIVGGDSIVIKDNIFHGAYTTTLGAIDNATTATTGCQVINNAINNLTASSAKAMSFQTGSTGMIRDNTMQILTGTAPIAGAAMSWVGRNYYAAAVATAGTLI